MKIIRLETTTGTNAYLRSHMRELQSPVAVTAKYQTEGRGQRGNTWNSEKGANVLLSLLYRSAEEIHPRDQFAVSMAVSLAVTELLDGYGLHTSIKWPNDIYISDRKIAGILIENGFTGSRIDWSIAGIGLNVNQTTFLPEIPNPISMKMISGRQYDTDAVSEALCDCLTKRLDMVKGYSEALMTEYMGRLWRADGKLYPFLDTATSERFHARICAVEPSGTLVLEDSAAATRRYFFKEVGFLI